MMKHLATYHAKRKLSVRHRWLDEASGILGYKSLHFDSICGLVSTVDFLNSRVTVKKRPQIVCDEESYKKVKTDMPSDLSLKCGPVQEESDMQKLEKILPDVVHTLNNMGRADDFGSVLQAIANGKIQNNIALHLLLDVGQFLRQDTPQSMRYNQTSLDFWTLMMKVVHGKGMRLLEGENGVYSRVVLTLH